MFNEGELPGLGGKLIRPHALEYFEYEGIRCTEVLPSALIIGGPCTTRAVEDAMTSEVVEEALEEALGGPNSTAFLRLVAASAGKGAEEVQPPRWLDVAAWTNEVLATEGAPPISPFEPASCVCKVIQVLQSMCSGTSNGRGRQ